MTMPPLHVVRLVDCVPQPWRNDGGFTRELLRWPTDAAGDRWQVRVSVAEVASDGPFSDFRGVERWFAVLQGDGVRLALGETERTLMPSEAPLQFAGELAPGCRLISGPSTDLNLMHRRGIGTADMRLAAQGSTLAGPTAWRAIYAHSEVQIGIDGELYVLPASCLAWAEQPGSMTWHMLGDAPQAYWMSLRR